MKRYLTPGYASPPSQGGKGALITSTWLLVGTLVGCALPFHDLGALSKPAIVTGRDGGASVLIDGRVLWMFGDTLMTATGVDGFNFRSATAAWGAPGKWSLDDTLDAHGTPLQLFPYTSDELAYNQSHGPDDRYALWPGSAITAPDGSGAWIFYQRLKIHPGDLNYEGIDIGLARLAVGSTVAVRDSAPLFTAAIPAYVLGAVVANSDVYLYGCTPVPKQLDQTCGVIRALVADAPLPAAWQTWDGKAWNSDVTKAATVLHGAPGDLSVSFNAHLGKYLAVYSAIFSNDVMWRTAPAPEGPWSEARKLFTALSPSSGNDYGAKEHPELSSNGGKRIVVSYAHGTGAFSGDVRLAWVDLP